MDLIDVENAIVTADSMSCQKTIVKKISKEKADYVIGLKGNQPTLLEDVSLYFKDFSQELPKHTTKDIDHGRVENREYQLLTDILWLSQKNEWTNLKGIEVVKSTVYEKEEKYKYNRYFITSLTDLNEFAYAVRKHLSIENQLHWCLDVIFGEDSSRAKKDNSPLNLNVLRKTALSLVNQAKSGRLSKKKIMFKAALNPDMLLKAIPHNRHRGKNMIK